MKRWMRKAVYLWIAFGLAHCTANADTPRNGKVVLDFWDAAYLQGGKAGYVHTIVHETNQDGKILYHSSLELHLKVKRFRETIQLRMETGTVETKDGKVVGTFLRHYLGRAKKLEIIGKVDGKWLRLMRDGENALKPAPWDAGVAGLFQQQNFLAENRVKPGDKLSYQSFEPSINLVLKSNVTVKDFEKVELFNGKIQKKLLRVEVRPQKIENVQLPPLISWVNEQFIPIRQEMEIPGLGKIRLYRTTKSVALSPGPVANLPDIGIGQYLRLSRRIIKPYETKKAVYRVTVKNDENPTTTFSSDDRQRIKNAKGATFELHVRATAAGPDSTATNKKAGKEFTQSSYFINCDDARVKSLAKQAVGTETNPRKKALRIERWVHHNVKPRAHEALATADHVARTLKGDCSEFAMLTAAMCRAVAIPSRTAVGLIYANVPQGPVFAFHMWTEVHIGGSWMAIDATLGKGRIGATHLKISDQSWHQTRSMTPLFPLIRVLGRVRVEVIDVQ